MDRPGPACQAPVVQGSPGLPIAPHPQRRVAGVFVQASAVMFGTPATPPYGRRALQGTTKNGTNGETMDPTLRKPRSKSTTRPSRATTIDNKPRPAPELRATLPEEPGPMAMPAMTMPVRPKVKPLALARINTTGDSHSSSSEGPPPSTTPRSARLNRLVRQERKVKLDRIPLLPPHDAPPPTPADPVSPPSARRKGKDEALPMSPRKEAAKAMKRAAKSIRESAQALQRTSRTHKEPPAQHRSRNNNQHTPRRDTHQIRLDSESDSTPPGTPGMSGINGQLPIFLRSDFELGEDIGELLFRILAPHAREQDSSYQNSNYQDDYLDLLGYFAEQAAATPAPERGPLFARYCRLIETNGGNFPEPLVALARTAAAAALLARHENEPGTPLSQGPSPSPTPSPGPAPSPRPAPSPGLAPSPSPSPIPMPSHLPAQAPMPSPAPFAESEFIVERSSPLDWDLAAFLATNFLNSRTIYTRADLEPAISGFFSRLAADFDQRNAMILSALLFARSNQDTLETIHHELPAMISRASQNIRLL